MRVAVTGGAGYVGSAIVEALLATGHQVMVFDSLATGHRESLAGQEITLIQGDLAERAAIDRAFQTFGVEAVIHTAGSIEAGESMRNPGKYYQNNVVNSINLLDAMAENGVKRLVFSSSAGVYGNPTRVPIEEDDPKVPENCYGETKLVIERAAAWYGRTGLRSVFLRYFNAAGATERLGEAHDPETHVIPLCLQVALGQRERFSIYGTDYPTPDGTAIRDFVHIADLAQAHVRALELSWSDANSPAWEAFNLGSGTGFSVREVVEMARKVSGRPIPVAETPRRPGDPAALVANPRKAIEQLGWTPRFGDLESIIASAWRWHQRHPRGYRS